MIKLRRLDTSELPWANQCYAEVKFQPSQADDLICVAEIDGVKAGLGRLIRIDAQTGELGGIYALPAFRGQGVARAVVGYLLEQSPYPRLFCIPFKHLEGFYRGFGFSPVPQDLAIPKAVSSKMCWCTSEYDAGVALLVREENQPLT